MLRREDKGEGRKTTYDDHVIGGLHIRGRLYRYGRLKRVHQGTSFTARAVERETVRETHRRPCIKTICAVSLKWILLGSQLTVELIANKKMLVNTRTVQGENSIRIHCNSGAKILNRVGDILSYGNVWYELTGIDNILSMLRATKKFRVVFDSKGRNFSG